MLGYGIAAQPYIPGGEGGSRTHERLAPLSVFETDALDHYATSPYRHCCTKLKDNRCSGVTPYFNKAALCCLVG
jgi:hypothetical protein